MIDILLPGPEGLTQLTRNIRVIVKQRMTLAGIVFQIEEHFEFLDSIEYVFPASLSDGFLHDSLLPDTPEECAFLPRPLTVEDRKDIDPVRCSLRGRCCPRGGKNAGCQIHGDDGLCGRLSDRQLSRPPLSLENMTRVFPAKPRSASVFRMRPTPSSMRSTMRA